MTKSLILLVLLGCVLGFIWAFFIKTNPSWWDGLWMLGMFASVAAYIGLTDTSLPFIEPGQ